MLARIRSAFGRTDDEPDGDLPRRTVRDQYTNLDWSAVREMDDLLIELGLLTDAERLKPSTS